jgi:hypothetical protein
MPCASTRKEAEQDCRRGALLPERSGRRGGWCVVVTLHLVSPMVEYGTTILAERSWSVGDGAHVAPGMATASPCPVTAEQQEHTACRGPAATAYYVPHGFIAALQCRIEKRRE